MFSKLLLLTFCSQNVIFKIFYLPNLILSFCFQILILTFCSLIFSPNFFLKVCFPNFFLLIFLKFHQMVVSKFFSFVIFISYLLYIFSLLQILSLRFFTKFCVYKCLYLIFIVHIVFLSKQREGIYGN